MVPVYLKKIWKICEELLFLCLCVKINLVVCIADANQRLKQKFAVLAQTLNAYL
jgi:hypothetical protein